MAMDGTYSGLLASIGDWLNRSDLTAQIPDFIILAEAQMKRRLRRASLRVSNFTVDARNKTIPAGMAELRSIYFQSAEPARDVPLRICTPEMLAERAARSAGVAGRPTDV